MEIRTAGIPFVAAILLLTTLPLPAQSQELGDWVRTTDYPLRLEGVACVTDVGYLYCIGGQGGFPPVFVNSSYYAPITPSGLGPWARTTDYPANIAFQACLAQTDYVFCFGGVEHKTGDDPFKNDATSASYYAPLSSSGIGRWVRTTSYPDSLANQMCVTSSAYVYCTGGSSNPFNPSTGVNSSFYAPMSSSGIGSWRATARLPIPGQQAANVPCAAEDGYVYCMQGGVHYASLTASGIGPWAEGPPRVGGQSCAAQSGYVYCVGGASDGYPTGGTSYARDMTPGLTPFVNGTAYPLPFDIFFTQYSCAAGSGRVYCVGGQACQSPGPPPTGCEWSKAVYYADIVPSRTIIVYILCCDSHNTPYFFPQSVTVIAGLNNTVRWYSSVPEANVTAKDGSFSTGPIDRGSLSGSITLGAPGTYEYDMTGVFPRPTGTIRVVEAIIITTTTTIIVPSPTTSTTSVLRPTTVATSSSAEGPTSDLVAVEIAAVASVAVALIAGLWLGSHRRRDKP